MSHRAQFLRYLDCYARKDLQGISAMLADDVVLRDWDLSVRGRAAVEGATRGNFAAARSIEIAVLTILEGEQSVAGELRIVVDGSNELFVVDVIAFDAQSRITAIRAYRGRGD